MSDPKLKALSEQLDAQIEKFEDELKLCEERAAGGPIPGHRHSVDLQSWQSGSSALFTLVDDVSPALVFFARCAIRFLRAGSISEKELRTSVIETCKRSEVRVNNRGGLSASYVDLSIICGVLQTLGVLDEEKKSKMARKAAASTPMSMASEGGDGAASEDNVVSMKQLRDAVRLANAAVVSAMANCDMSVEEEPLRAAGDSLEEAASCNRLAAVSEDYFVPTCGVDKYLLKTFSDRLKSLLEQLDEKIRVVAANAPRVDCLGGGDAVDADFLAGMFGDVLGDVEGAMDMDMDLDLDREDGIPELAEIPADEHDLLLLNPEYHHGHQMDFDATSEEQLIDSIGLPVQDLLTSVSRLDHSAPLYSLAAPEVAVVAVSPLGPPSSNLVPPPQPAASMSLGSHQQPLASHVAIEQGPNILDRTEYPVPQRALNEGAVDAIDVGEEARVSLHIQLGPQTPEKRVPAFTEGDLLAKGVRARKVGAMCMSLKHIDSYNLYFKPEFNGTPIAASVSFCDSLETGSVAAENALLLACSGPTSLGEDGMPLKPKRGRRPKIKLPADLAPDGMECSAEMPSPEPPTPASMAAASEAGPGKKAGQKSFNSNFGSRVWKMNHDRDELFENPRELLSQWAEVCYLGGCVEEMEESVVRQLAGLCEFKMPIETSLLPGTSYLETIVPPQPLFIPRNLSSGDLSVRPAKDAADPQAPLESPANSSASGGRRRSNASGSAPATLNADQLLNRFKRRAHAAFGAPILSLCENKMVSFKSSSAVGAEDMMLDTEDSHFDFAAHALVSRKRSKNGSLLSGPSLLDVAARRQPLPMNLFYGKGDGMEAEMRHWEAVARSHDPSEEESRRQDDGDVLPEFDDEEPRLMYNTIESKTSSLLHYQPGLSGKYMHIPDLIISTEPMNWQCMAAEFSLLGDTIVGEQSLLYSSGGELTPGGANFCERTPGSIEALHESNNAFATSGDRYDCVSGTVHQNSPNANWTSAVVGIEGESTSHRAMTGRRESKSPSRKAKKFDKSINKSMSGTSLVSLDSAVSSIAGITETLSKHNSVRHSDSVNMHLYDDSEELHELDEDEDKEDAEAYDQHASSSSVRKRRRKGGLTISVTMSNHRDSHREGSELGSATAGYSAKKFAAVQSPSYRLIKPAHTIDSDSTRGGCDETLLAEESDEDTSDEAFTARHDAVLEHMREKWQAIQALRKERKELRKKEKSGRLVPYSSGNSTKRPMVRSASFGSDQGDGTRRKRTGSVTQSLVSVEHLLVSSPRKRVPVNRDIEAYAPPLRPPPPRKDHSKARVVLDANGNPIVRKRGRPQKVAPIT